MTSGELLNWHAKVQRVGKTSITAHVGAFSERNPAGLLMVKLTEANLTGMAIDHQGKPRHVPAH